MSPFLQLALLLAIVVTAAKFGGLVSLRLGRAAVLGELLVGVILGPTLLNILGWPLFASEVVPEMVFQLAELGVVFLMFIAGLEVDLDAMARSGRPAGLAAILGVLLPLGGGTAAALVFGLPVPTALLIGLVLTATSVSISAQTLFELDQLRSRVGVTLLGAAVIDDVLGVLALSIFLALVGGPGTLSDIFLTILRLVTFLVGFGLLGVRYLPPLIARVARLPVAEPIVTSAVVITLFLAFSAEALGHVAAITGAFLAGVLFARTHYREEIVRGLHSMTSALLVPLFFVSIGLRTDVSSISPGFAAFVAVIILIAVVTKLAGCGLGGRLAGLSSREALQLGAGMVSRGEVGLIVATVGVQNGIVGPDIFAVAVVVVLATTLVTPVLLQWAFGMCEVSFGRTLEGREERLELDTA